MKALQMQSCVHENATVECALVEITIPDPKPDEVVVAVEDNSVERNPTQ